MSLATIADTTSYQSHREKNSGLRQFPLLGVLPHLRRDPPEYLLQIAREHAAVLRFKLGPENAVLVANPEGVERVLRSNSTNYLKTKFADKLKPILGNGVAIANGEEWDRSRRAVQKTFTRTDVNAWIGGMDEAIQEYCIRELTGSEIDSANCFSGRMTLTVLFKTVFGISDPEAVSKFTSTVEELQSSLGELMWAVNPLASTKLTRSGRTLHRHSAQLREQTAELANRALAKDPEGTVNNLATLLGTDFTSEASFTDLVDQLITIFIAGHETTGNTLAWAFNILARSPELQQTLREEALMNLAVDQLGSASAIKQMPLTTSFLQEVMRLYPSAWWFVRTAQADDEILGTKIQAGDVIIISPYVTHRLAEFWDAPDKFDAERFLARPARHKFEYIPFGAGPRTCPGGHFAMSEMVLAVARVLMSRELDAGNSPQPKHDALVTLRPQEGAPIALRDHSRAYWIKQCDVGGHALVEAAMRMRKRIFVDSLGWPVAVDQAGRERDQFDCDDANYLVVVSNSRIMTCGRALPACRPTLLYDVYGHIISDPGRKTPGRTMWEGSRMATDPDLTSTESRRWIWELVYQSARQAIREGIDEMVAASDPVLFRVLRRVGANPEPIGDVIKDEHGFNVQAVSIKADFSTLKSMLERSNHTPLKSSVLFGRRLNHTGSDNMKEAA